MQRQRLLTILICLLHFQTLSIQSLSWTAYPNSSRLIYSDYRSHTYDKFMTLNATGSGFDQFLYYPEIFPPSELSYSPTISTFDIAIHKAAEDTPNPGEHTPLYECN